MSELKSAETDVYPGVYIETSIISNLTSKPSLNVRTLALQQETRLWWKHRRQRFRLFISSLVRDEIGRGDPEARLKRLHVIEGIEELEIVPEILKLARKLIEKNLLPVKAVDDAVHIATAAFHGIDYLLTWNCTHIANNSTFPRVRDTIENEGYRCPMMTTPLSWNLQEEERT